jgi:replication factor C small subunit
MKELKKVAWNIKYRPYKILDIVSEHNEKIKKYVMNIDEIPNFLFYSRVGGTGKSSMGLAIINELGVDSLKLNASADRSIEVVRTKIRDFARSQSTNGLKKCVYCDEAERLTTDAAEALKNLIEETALNCFYIFTTNNINKISQPLQSRFTARYEFTKPAKEEVYKYLENICKNEGLEYTENGLNKLIDLYYPSIRNCVNTLQDLKISERNVSIGSVTSTNDEWVSIWKEIEEKKYNSILEKTHKNLIDVYGFTNWVFEYMISYEDITKKIKIIQILRDLLYDLKMGVDEAPAFMAHIGRIMMVFK